LPLFPTVIVENPHVIICLGVRFDRLIALAVVAAACAHPAAPPVVPAAKVVLVKLPAESDSFPDAAKAMTTALGAAQVAGVDETSTSKVSIEVVQLSIECLDATPACYDAVAKSLSATKLLFASIGNDGTKPKISVTVFDAGAQPRTKERTFDTEAAAIAGAAKLVTEAVR